MSLSYISRVSVRVRVGYRQPTIYPTNRLFKTLNLIEISPDLSKLCFFSYTDDISYREKKIRKKLYRPATFV